MTNLHKLDTAVLHNIPRVLRSIADEIENGTYHEAINCVVVLEAKNKQVEVFGGGITDYHRAMAILVRAQHRLIDMN
jgi:hypothetical protein